MSSLFDVATFTLLGHLIGTSTPAGQTAFRTGWFTESLLTQILAVQVIRTGRVPLLHSRPAKPVALTALAGCTLAVVLPATGVGASLGLTPARSLMLAGIAIIVAAYLLALQAGKMIY